MNTFTTGVWLLVIAGVLAWFVVSLALSLLIGRIARNRDRQIPRDEP